MSSLSKIPSWVGRSSVDETKHTTLRLLQAWAEIVGQPFPIVIGEFEEMSDKDAIKAACDLANKLQEHSEDDPEKAGIGIWVGFPETPLGRLNAKLAGRVWHLKEK